MSTTLEIAATVELAPEETERLAALEATIHAGMQTFVDVGQALMEIRDSRLYRQAFATFEEYCQERWNMVRRQADRLIQAAEVTQNLRPFGLIPATEAHARPLTQLDPEQQVEAWTQALATAPNGKITAAHVQSVVDELYGDDDDVNLVPSDDTDEPDLAPDDYKPLQPDEIEVTEDGHIVATWQPVSKRDGYDSDEWYTPAEYIEAAREVMGGIGLDPASCELAQTVVKAERFLTKEDDGLHADWYQETVFVNPPYGQTAPWVDKVIDEYDAGLDVKQVIILVNNATETTWFQKLLERFPVCFPSRRLSFWRHDQEGVTARQGQAIFYLGDNLEKFIEVFGAFGPIMRRWKLTEDTDE